MTDDRDVIDVIVVGGGPAGLTAALYLGRARRSVLVCDRGDPRHAVSAGVHNFLSRDGMPPAALRETAWEQMAAYPSVAHRRTTVTRLARRGELWQGQLQDGPPVLARAVLLATGVVDQHPELPGYRERWGHSVHHCPFCHGWELRDVPLAALVHGPAAGQYAPLVRNWSSDVVLLTHGGELPDDARTAVERAGIAIHEARIESLEGPGRELARVRLSDGTVLARKGVFVKPTQTQVGLIRDLGVTLGDDGYVQIDNRGLTSLPGVWAAGDLTTGYQQVVEAAAQGARAAVMIVKTFTSPG